MKVFIYLFFSFLCLVSQAGVTFRYNNLGYTPKRNKRILVQSDQELKKRKWKIKNSKGETVLKGKLIKNLSPKNEFMPKAYNYEIDFSSVEQLGEYTVFVKKEKPFKVYIKKQPYTVLIDDILHYLRAQRSGSKYAYDHPISHLGDSACPVMVKKGIDNKNWVLDENHPKMNLVGGWYNAGDYIKSTATISYTTYLLLRAYEQNPNVFHHKHSLTKWDDLLDEAKYGLDYLLKTLPDTNNFVIQVGGAIDHAVGFRLHQNDTLDGQRKAYVGLAPNQMAYAAAALALGSKVFHELHEDELANLYQSKAFEYYHLAVKEYLKPTWVQEGWEAFYVDEEKEDNLLLASIELYELTHEEQYLKEIHYHAEKAKTSNAWASWNNANLLAHFRTFPYDDFVQEYIVTDLDSFQNIANQEGNIWRMPHEYHWGTLYSFLEVANASLLYKNQMNDTKYEQMALDVLDYTLGANNWGLSMIVSKNLPNSIEHVFAQTYMLQPDLYPMGAVCQGPGDRKTHERVKQYYKSHQDEPFEEFNTEKYVFFDGKHNFQCMEPTITGLADAIFFFTLMSSLYE